MYIFACTHIKENKNIRNVAIHVGRNVGRPVGRPVGRHVGRHVGTHVDLTVMHRYRH